MPTNIYANFLRECTAAFGVFVDGVHCKDNTIDALQIRTTLTSVIYSTPLVFDMVNGASWSVGALTANIAINPPTNMVADDILKIVFLQDGTGGRTITWNAVFHGAYSNTGNTANKFCVIQYHYTGSVWLMDYFSGWYA